MCCSPGPEIKTVKQELWLQLRLAFPIILMNLLQFGIQLSSVMFVGHLGELALSSSSVATSIATVTGSSLLMGLSFAMETLCGQAYGAKQYNLLGIYLQRAWIVLFPICILVSVAWANMEQILLLLGQEAAISEQAGAYIQCLIPFLFGYAAAQPLIKFLQAQSLVIPLMMCTAFTFCCHLPACYAMVYKTGLGLRGAALATSISTWMNVFILALYVMLSPSCKKTRPSLSLRAFHDLAGFIKLAVPSAVMTCLEWWSYEALVILSGLLPDPELETSALSICYNSAIFAFMVPNGLGGMASTRVSNELGAGRPRAAYRAVYVSCATASCEAVVVFTTFMLLRNDLGRAYSDEEEVIKYISQITPVLAASAVLDSIQGLLSGIVRGCGWQKAGAYINLASYYIVGLPLALLFAFVFHVKAEGLWMGISTGSIVQLFALVAITWATDWEKEAINAAARISPASDDSTEPLLPKY